MAAAGGPRLIFQFTVDTSNFDAGAAEVNQTITKIGVNAQQVGGNMAVFGDNINNITIQMGNASRATRQSTEQFAGFLTAMTRLGFIARQVMSIYTMWTVWQIRVTQYENQLREARQRQTAAQAEQIRMSEKYGVVTRQMLSALHELYTTQLGIIGSFDSLRRATGNLVIAIGRYGPESEEAADATIEWNQAMLKWGEQAVRMGVPMDKVRTIMNALIQSIRSQQIPNWRTFGEVIEWDTAQFGPLGSAGLTAGNLISQSANNIVGALENILPVQEDIAKTQADWTKRMDDANADVESSSKKLADAQREVWLQMSLIGVQAFGLVAQFANVILTLNKAAEAAGKTTSAYVLMSIKSGILTLAHWAHVAAVAVLKALLDPLGLAIALGVAAVALATIAWWQHTEAVKAETEAQKKLNEARKEMPEEAPGGPEAIPGAPAAGRHRQIGGVIPVTGPYEMHAGEVVTPEPLARRGAMLGAVAPPRPSEVHYHFGDIKIQVQQLAGEQDMRETAIKLRRYIQQETARTG